MTSCAGNRRILSTPDRTCHQVPRSVEFLAICSSFSVSTASCRLTWTAPSNQSGFGKITIYRNTYGVPYFLHFAWCSIVLHSMKHARASNTISASQTNHPATRAAFPEMGSRVDDLNIRQYKTPVFGHLSVKGRSTLVEVCPAGCRLFTEAPKKRRWGEDGPHRCRDCAGEQEATGGC